MNTRDSNARLEAQGQRIRDLISIAVETEKIGTATLTDLDIQGEQLLRARDTLYETNDQISRSQSLLRRIRNRIGTNKCLLIFIILLILCAITIIVLLVLHSQGRI